MTVKEYYEAPNILWDDDSLDSELARHAATIISMPRNGGSVLDIGCGTGGMFRQLIENGAYEIIGIDISERMLGEAESEAGGDARITLMNADFMDFDDGGYDLAIAFNSYNHFPDPEAFAAKAYSLLNKGGRLTVAYAFGRERTNAISRVMPAGVSRALLPPWRELQSWSKWFNIDCMCDNDQMFILSGVAF